MATDPSMLILVVDQNKAMIRIVRNLLRQLDFQNVDDASDGNEALAKLKEREYGFAICDLKSELLTGSDPSKPVRVDEVLENLPFIIMADGSNPESIIAAQRASVHTYIVKPFNAQTLKGKIETEIKNRRKRVRRRVVKGGQLAYDKGAHTVECLIRDLSESGARIQVASAQDIPTELVLHFDEGGAPRPCLVRWRSSNAIGVEFTDASSGLENLF